MFVLWKEICQAAKGGHVPIFILELFYIQVKVRKISLEEPLERQLDRICLNGSLVKWQKITVIKHIVG